MDEGEDLVEDLLTEYAIQLSIQESNGAKPPVSSSYNDRYRQFNMLEITPYFNSVLGH